VLFWRVLCSLIEVFVLMGGCSMELEQDPVFENETVSRPQVERPGCGGQAYNQDIGKSVQDAMEWCRASLLRKERLKLG